MMPLVAGDLVELKLTTGDHFAKVRIMSFQYGDLPLIEFESLSHERFLVGVGAVAIIIPLTIPV